MKGHRDALFLTMLGFALTSAVMLPPVISARSEKAARIAVHDAEIATNAVDFGQERQARLAHLLRRFDEREPQNK